MTCPNGHTSESDDYCDVCGSPIDAVGPAGPRPVGGAGATGPYAAGPAAAPHSRCRSGWVGRPADPALDTRRAGGGAGRVRRARAGLARVPELRGGEPARRALLRGVRLRLHDRGDAPRRRRGRQLNRDQSDAAVATVAGRRERRVRPRTVARARSGPRLSEAASFDWLAEVWIDPDWYKTQEAEDPCPSPGLPIIIPLRSRSVLMGRVSQSRNTHPEIDLSSDPGVSRRHAQLTTDGTRWFVEDLGSSNGTFVGAAAGPLPDDPIAVGPKTELGDDDRLYVGAWTRVVVRRATPDEVEAYA